MPGYIDKDEAVRMLVLDYAYAAAGMVKEMLPVDVAPVVHGRWEECDWVEPDPHGFGTNRTPKGGLHCSNCLHVFKKELLWRDNFCPNFGARMGGGNSNE